MTQNSRLIKQDFLDSKRMKINSFIKTTEISIEVALLKLVLETATTTLVQISRCSSSKIIYQWQRMRYWCPSTMKNVINLKGPQLTPTILSFKGITRSSGECHQVHTLTLEAWEWEWVKILTSKKLVSQGFLQIVVSKEAEEATETF